mgnify:CR=1 FL=1
MPFCGILLSRFSSVAVMPSWLSPYCTATGYAGNFLIRVLGFRIFSRAVLQVIFQIRLCKIVLGSVFRSGNQGNMLIRQFYIHFISPLARYSRNFFFNGLFSYFIIAERFDGASDIRAECPYLVILLSIVIRNGKGNIEAACELRYPTSKQRGTNRKFPFKAFH